MCVCACVCVCVYVCVCVRKEREIETRWTIKDMIVDVSNIHFGKWYMYVCVCV